MAVQPVPNGYPPTGATTALVLLRLALVLPWRSIPNQVASRPSTGSRSKSRILVMVSARFPLLFPPLRADHIRWMLQATWVNHHFTDDIQTRQYRCPEVLLGARWGPSADIWSMACVVRPFDPILPGFSPVDEFLSSYLSSSPAGITSLTHKLDRGTARTRIILRRSSNLLAISHSPSHFRANTAHASSTEKVCSDSHQTLADSYPLVGELRHINKLRFWPLEDVLHDKYEFSRETAQTIASFLSPMLRLNPEKRAGAGELVHHRWLDGIVVQGEIDVIRRAEEEEARRRLPSSSVPTAIDVDALKPVDDDSPTTDEERPPAGVATANSNAPPTLHMPRPASATAKENLKQALAKQESGSHNRKHS